MTFRQGKAEAHMPIRLAINYSSPPPEHFPFSLTMVNTPLKLS